MAYNYRHGKKRKGELLHVEAVLSKAHPEFTEGDFERICATWKAVVSETIFAMTRPAQLKDNTLIVHVQSHGWLQEVTFQKNQIKQKLGKKIPQLQLRAIHFRVGSVERHTQVIKKKSPAVKPVATSQIPENIARSLATIRDQKIRDELKKIVAVSLAR